RKNSISGSRKNIAEHYDLSNDFFKLFLDPSLMYSSAVFENENMTLEEASDLKKEIICKKLDLKPLDHLVEIGSGWGGFAIYAAQHYGCRVTTITISQAQYDEAVTRVNEAGLAHRI
ncbi:cyclopropane-fatty-acyl-phospholipid synthase family protein, partial [Acinetobacter baumannii]